MQTICWAIGEEYDDKALSRLGEALRSLNYEQIDTWQGLGGSQEICHWKLAGPDGYLTIETETYLGLTVEGPVRAMEQLRQRYALLP
ncbi:hypothetical protein [Vogesella indigofera]|uniref:hypothetical protein n=1 Tax=Vogesella indigofera TaxID=45465 RepID=UPI00234ECCEB|nr:hypothetical protein [Vogesella indigofera]MDC7702039.1 hypothetical protein [Vogesella indigofera]